MHACYCISSIKNHKTSTTCISCFSSPLLNNICHKNDINMYNLVGQCIQVYVSRFYLERCKSNRETKIKDNLSRAFSSRDLVKKIDDRSIALHSIVAWGGIVGVWFRCSVGSYHIAILSLGSCKWLHFYYFYFIILYFNITWNILISHICTNTIINWVTSGCIKRVWLHKNVQNLRMTYL